MKKQELNDHELILGYLAGNDSSFEKLLLRHKRKVFSVIYSIVGDRYVAEELFQETFIKVIHQIRDNRYHNDDKFAQWVSRIARNMSLDYLRRVKHQPMVVDSDGIDVFNYIQMKEASYEDQFIDQENFAMLRNLIKKLPKIQQEVLILKHYGNYSFKEIAELTNVSLNTALGRMRYAILNLRKMMIVQNIRIQ